MTTTVIEPANGDVLAQVERGGEAEVDAAVAAAVAAQRDWAAMPATERGRLLMRVAERLDENRDSLAELEARNVGKPIVDARAEVANVVECFEFYAAGPQRLLGSTIPVDGGIDMTFWEPLGVVGLITPWNFPLAIASWKVAPAIAAGNSVVLKPAELTPLTALRLEQLILEAGIPEGVVNVVNGPGSICGTRLSEHPQVAKIAFTGSTEVGRQVSRAAAGTIKRLTLELGGKSAGIVFADSDLVEAAQKSAAAVFGNAGQDCCARSRILVQAEAVDEFMVALEEATVKTLVGDPLDEGTQMGPLISHEHRAKVESFLEADVNVAITGKVPEGNGAYFPPTVLFPIEPDRRAAKEEIFGPVACVIPFRDEAEAIAIANDTIYGLSGSIWTRDGARALRMARALETGTISINSSTSVRVGTPFGGFKQSGIGRELGPDAVQSYSELKNVYFAT